MIYLDRVVVDGYDITAEVRVDAPEPMVGLEYNYMNSLRKAILEELYTISICYVKMHQWNLDSGDHVTNSMSMNHFALVLGQLPLKQTSDLADMSDRRVGTRNVWYNNTNEIIEKFSNDLEGVETRDSYLVTKLSPGEVIAFDIYPVLNNRVLSRPFGDDVGFKSSGKPGVYYLSLKNRRVYSDEEVPSIIQSAIDIVNEEPERLMHNVKGTMDTSVVFDKEGKRVPIQSRSDTFY